MNSFVKRFWIAALLLVAIVARATTLIQLTLDELISDSALVFTGSVLTHTTIAEGDLIYTVVEFTVDEVITGEALNDTLSLRFVGGELDGHSSEVAGQFIPAIGARGLWFVAETERAMVNPLTGWSQGYFPLVDGSDGVTYLDLRGHPDYGLLEEEPPLAGKMRDLAFTREQIAERFPERFQYPLADFAAVIAAGASGD